MSTKLKPCPFCGTKPKLRSIVEHYEADADGPAGSYDVWWSVNCDECGIKIGDEYRVDAETNWNKRAATRAREQRARNNG